MNEAVELRLLQELSTSAYKLLGYFRISCGDSLVLWGKTREDFQKGTNLSYVTVNNALKELQEKGCIEYNGHRKFTKLLTLSE